MKKQSHNSKSILHSQVTATISVALLLLMLGIIVLAGFTVRGLASSLSEEVGFTVVMNDSISEANSAAIGRKLNAEPYTRSAVYVSPEQVLARWNEMLGTGDSLLESNPFLSEWQVKVREPWTAPDSLRAITARVRTWPGVADAPYYEDMARAAESTLSTLTLILVACIAVLTLISFVLINNTMRLAVHSRRLSIHAMQLVGATGGFIRRPFVVSACIGGLIAASAASVLILAAYFYILSVYPSIATLLTLKELAITIAALYVAGALISSLGALFSTNRYLRSDYDELFN